MASRALVTLFWVCFAFLSVSAQSPQAIKGCSSMCERFRSQLPFPTIFEACKKGCLTKVKKNNMALHFDYSEK